MQEIIFTRMVNIIDCANANLNELNIIASSANKCTKYLINKIQISSSSNSCQELSSRITIRNKNDFAKLKLKANCQDIQNNVHYHSKDLTFLDTYFEIIFFKLIALCFNQIIIKM